MTGIQNGSNRNSPYQSMKGINKEKITLLYNIRSGIKEILRMYELQWKIKQPADATNVEAITLKSSQKWLIYAPSVQAFYMEKQNANTSLVKVDAPCAIGTTPGQRT